MDPKSDHQCPFEDGDRVEHQIFGRGTVSGTPVDLSRKDAALGVELAGWRVTVKWDDPGKPEGNIGSSSLTKISSPDDRSFTYWDSQWQPLLQAWKHARRAVEDATASFRPMPDPVQLLLLHRAEDEAWQAVLRFLDEEAAGRH